MDEIEISRSLKNSPTMMRIALLLSLLAAMIAFAAETPAPKAEVSAQKISLLLRGDTPTESAPHGGGNVYAPEVHRDGTRWFMWYGGQGSDGHDRIHLAESADGLSWKKRGVVLDCGTANHVNDPSVVRVGKIWWMFYTVAEKAEQDEIAAATSSDGVIWKKLGVVLKPGGSGAWDSLKVGRPSVLWEEGHFRMWYDGQPTDESATTNPIAAVVKREGRAVGYAQSPDGLHWKRNAEPIFHEGSGAIHVSHIGSRWIMLMESSTGVRWAQSPDGLTWKSRGRLLPLSGEALDLFGQVTPFLQHDEAATRIFLGAAARRTWDGNSIGCSSIVLPD